MALRQRSAVSVYVTISTSSDGPLIDITIANEGPAPGADDLRHYSWTSTDGQRGSVTHRRSHGLMPLVRAVLTQVETPP